MEKIINHSRLSEGTALHQDRYEIRRFLGQGGFGITYEAWDRTLQITVAIKEFFPSGQVYRNVQQSWQLMCLGISGAEDSFEKGKKRFLHEAQVLAGLNSYHIVRVYDSFADNGTVYIVMEYLSGPTLADYVKQNGSMDSQTVLSQFIPLMEELDAIHKSGLIHRDISPDNIMFTKEEKLKIIDFGTARDLAPEGDKSVSTSIVHLHYSPIEMFASGRKSCQADIYSLCATMYYCLTGKEPEISVERAFSDSLELPSRIAAVPKNLERVLLRGMAVKPENRYASVAEMLADLQQSRSPKLAKRIAVAVAAVSIVAVGIHSMVTKQPEPEVSVKQPVPEWEELESVEPEPAEPEPAEPYILVEGICWENPAGIVNPGKNQTLPMECAAVQAKYKLWSIYTVEDINLNYVKQEFKRRLDLLNTEYAFGWAEEEETTLYVQLPQQETPYHVLPMLIAKSMDVSLGGAFWKITSPNLTWEEDGSVTAFFASEYYREDLEEELKPMRDGEINSQTLYLRVDGNRVFRTELTEYPQDGTINFQELLLEKEDGQWDPTGFLALMKDIATVESNRGLDKYSVDEITFPNLDDAYYAVKADMQSKEALVDALHEDYPEMDAYTILDSPDEVLLEFHFPVDDSLSQSILTAMERTYALIADGSVENVLIHFAEEENEEGMMSERCRAFFTPGIRSGQMLLSYSIFGGRFTQCGEEINLRLDSESWPWDIDVSYTLETAGAYQLVREETFQLTCPVPADYVVDKDAYKSNLLVKMYSTETTNYVELYGKKLDEATTVHQAMQEAQASIDGTVELSNGGETWYVLSIRQSDGSYLYRKCRLVQSGTVLVWFDFHISQSGDQVAEQLEYMEDQFATGLPI